MRNYFKFFRKTSGFTLVELLIVIAIIGVMAAVLLVAIDPVEQLNKTKDAGLKQSLDEMGKAMQAYGLAKGGTFYVTSATDTTWIDSLVTAGELKTKPTAPSSVAITCAAGTGKSVQNSFCYSALPVAAPTGFLIYALPVSKSTNQLCTGVTPLAWYVYSSFDGRSGIVCKAAATEPTVASQTFAGS